MPVIYNQQIKPKGALGIWDIQEPEAFFLEKLQLVEAEQAQFDQIRGRRRVEWLASRHLLHLLSGREERGICYKDAFGKPHLENSPFQISMSHSHEMAAVIAAPCAVGIDIQFLVTKIDRIAHKFMRQEELDSLEDASRMEHLHVYWGAKESLYKAYGRKLLDFCTHIQVDPFAYSGGSGQCTGHVRKDAYQQAFTCHYERLGDYMLVYCLESDAG